MVCVIMIETRLVMEIKNVQITRESIKETAKLIFERFQVMQELYQRKEKFLKENNYKNDSPMQEIVVSSKPMLSFEVVMRNHSEKKTDLEWFVSFLDECPEQIEKVSIQYYCYYSQNATFQLAHKGIRCEEGVNISFTPEYINYTNRQENAGGGFEIMLRKFDRMIYDAPKRCDKVITGKASRKELPAIVTSLALGLLLTLTLYILFHFNIIDFGLKKHILTYYTVPLLFVVFILLGFSLPGRNHKLYRKLGLKQKYVGYNRSTKEDIYTTDFKNIENNCEVEIGKFANSLEIRAKIERNFKRAKIAILVETALFVILAVLFSV